MTPAARVQAAIEITDQINAGHPVEQALTRWARASRFAGSKDRAAVRDLVFEVVRKWRSTAVIGGGETGRARLLGLLRSRGDDIEAIYCGARHAPVSLTPGERDAGSEPTAEEARDVPDWLWPRFLIDVPRAQAEADVAALRERAPVDLRVNLRKCDVAQARARLEIDGVMSAPGPLCETVLRVSDGARKVGNTAVYQDGWVELQDAASQAVVANLPLREGARVLDYCAGGGGKALAMAARTGARVWAHDAFPKRMQDIPARAKRAGADIARVDAPDGLFDLVLCDVPCSGSGSWRRAPEGKWRLTPAKLTELCALQVQILHEAAAFVAPDGTLAYVTCSLLAEENQRQVTRFLSDNQEFKQSFSFGYRLSDGGDGFFVAVLTRQGARA